MLTPGLRNELQRIALLALLLVIAGYFNRHALLTLIAGGSLYMLWTLHRIHRLNRWLTLGGRDFPPPASGVWGEVSDHLYRLRQRITRHRQDHLNLLTRIRRITDALDEGIVILDADRALEWWNPAAGRLLQLRRGDEGEPIINLVRAPAFVAFIRAGQFAEPVELEAPSDPNRILQFSANHFGDNEVALVVQDISRLRHLEQMRKEFVANISHELRTPLTVLTGYLETLGDSAAEVPPSWRQALGPMTEQARRLTLLTEDLVTLSQLESTALPARPEPVPLKALLGGIVENARALGGGVHHIELDCPDGLVALGAARELHSAFANLVYNAVKHNPQGCTIEVRAGNDNGRPWVEVTDNGIGIDARHLPRLTERFYRVEGSRASSSGGTGLGLAIVKHSLLRNGGHLEIRSTPGKGSTFRCEFEPVPAGC
ncbi:MAG: phosphate regulon sensor histidine kinase PhoR [Porticoccaceae bacterium]